ncbi:MAG: FimV family protein, partial [Woeseiaceae bacterium]
DEEPTGVDTGIDTGDGEVPLTREQEILDRIAELEAADVPIQQSLIEIRDNELALLRQELADIRGEVYVPPVDDGTGVDDILADDSLADDAAADDAGADTTEPVADTSGADGGTLRTAPSEPSLVDQAIEILNRWWMWIAGVLLLVGALLFWFMRRGGDDDDVEDWGSALDADDMADTLAATESMRAPAHDESIVVVEQESGIQPLEDDTVETPMPVPEPIPAADSTGIQPVADFGAPEGGDSADATGQFGSLEDTFSSDTAVNLDQSDPIAEADFHMAYGLYDQAADLINGALQLEPERQDLLTKLCEIYFVWGNRDAFIDSSQKLKNAVGNAPSADWDKIVIMGQQIAGDHALFSGAGVAGVAKAVDLSFESEPAGDTGALDMEFGAEGGDDDVIDLGADTATSEAPEGGVDFMLDESAARAPDADDTTEQTADFAVTEEMPTIESSMDENTVETPTIEEQFAGFDGTSELPSISEDELGDAIESSGQASDATAEINLDELGLDVDGLAETEVA